MAMLPSNATVQIVSMVHREHRIIVEQATDDCPLTSTHFQQLQHDVHAELRVNDYTKIVDNLDIENN